MFTARRLWIAVPVAAAIVAGGALIAASASGDDGDGRGEPSTGTATVARDDIAERETVSGTLGFDDQRAVLATAQGTVTRLAGEGATVARGDVLYRVDDAPVRLMYGSVPAYRPLASGVDDGPDVRQLEANLRALGYDEDRDLVIDRHWDGATTAAVERWQDDIGAEVTGRVDLGQVVFLPAGTRRIASHQLSVGQPARPGQPVLTTTLTARAVTVQLDARRTDLLQTGRVAIVKLPSGERVNATVTEVGATATQPRGGGTPTIAVTVAIEDDATIRELDSAPVDVEIAGPTQKDALVAPITALLAVEGGGYGLEVVESDGSHRIVRVEPGVSADGRVAVTGDVAEGATVVTAR